MVKNAWIGTKMVIHDSDCMGPPRLFYPALPNLMNTLVTPVYVKSNRKSRYQYYEHYETGDTMQ